MTALVSSIYGVLFPLMISRVEPALLTMIISDAIEVLEDIGLVLGLVFLASGRADCELCAYAISTAFFKGLTLLLDGESS